MTCPNLMEKTHALQGWKRIYLAHSLLVSTCNHSAHADSNHTMTCCSSFPHSKHCRIRARCRRQEQRTNKCKPGTSFWQNQMHAFKQAFRNKLSNKYSHIVITRHVRSFSCCIHLIWTAWFTLPCAIFFIGFPDSVCHRILQFL